VRSILRPKSISFNPGKEEESEEGKKDEERRRLSGFRSPWMIPCECRTLIIFNNSLVKCAVRSYSKEGCSDAITWKLS